MAEYGMNYKELIRLLWNDVRLSKRKRIQKLSNQKVLFSKILELFALLFKKHIKVRARTFWGEDMVVVIPEVVSLNIFRYGFFEEGLTKMILKYFKPGMTFFDIGAQLWVFHPYNLFHCWR